MIVHPNPAGPLAITQATLSLLAFQLADHWGNRRTPRPSPRAEVLAAVLLRDDGRAEQDMSLQVDDGRVITRNTVPADELEALWSASVARALAVGMYVGYLVSHAVSGLARQASSSRYAAFLGSQEQLRSSLSQLLLEEARYRQLFATGGDTVNQGVLHACDALSRHLSRGEAASISIPGLIRVDGPAELVVRPDGPWRFRLHPWPFVGTRLDVSVTARRLDGLGVSSPEGVLGTWLRAPAVRLAWSLRSPGCPR